MHLTFDIIILVLLCMSAQTISAPNPVNWQLPSISQLFALNVASNQTSISAPQFPHYEEYKIPGTDLVLHLTLLARLDRNAMESCL